MPHLELDGGFQLFYEVRGSGPAVMFAHGAGGNALAWWQQVATFSERFTTITFDHRAFGRSPRRPSHCGAGELLPRATPIARSAGTA